MESIKNRILENLDPLLRRIKYSDDVTEVVTLNSAYYHLNTHIQYSLSVQMIVEKEFIGRDLFVTGIKVEDIFFIQDLGQVVTFGFTSEEIKGHIDREVKRHSQ